ncbi:MAG TPA: hypothetical protein VGE12_09360 [Noviherbaspirillum sp.]
MLYRLMRGLLCSAAMLSGSIALAAEGMTALLDRVAAAYGGKPPAAMIETGKTISFRRGEGVLERLYKAPDRFRIRIDYPAASESRTMIGARAWQQGTSANPILRGAIALQLARIALPWNVLERPSAATDLGTVSGPAGKSVRAIAFRMEEALELVIEIDPESGRILRSRGIQSVGRNTLEFATEYSDFRITDGRLHAAREEHFAMGQHTGYSLIEKVAYPATIPDSDFTP